MADRDVKWGIVSTIKADARTVLEFAAYHLDLGAHRLHIYLDEPNPEAYGHLKQHPKVRVTVCDSAYWKRHNRNRPAKHQFRQTLNATHAYERIQTDWIAHIDADEFLWPETDLGQMLAALPGGIQSARVRPVEALAGRDGEFKAMVPKGPDRETEVRALYPAFGSFLKGGFLSHTTGKVFARTGLTNAELRIHNLFLDGEKAAATCELDQADLCHCHAASWEHWQSVYRFRLQRGSYRPGLSAGFSRLLGGLSAHELLSLIEEEHGAEGLRGFFDEVSARDPDVYRKLQDRGLLRIRRLGLEEKRQKHFPGFG
ncbi:glycosyltransferase family 2 protein [Leisingera sp. McT4-56]|uniref:glycosyltransferase family 2 protein n=1 Tax=Leisingera sp. McT4-56 TaxID=2881255 RepID=UPI001CF88BBA|nr:glycosyltransferase family 2 protein [Leisingera sp. McT4-56]MCB4454623.1 glycosyltransferase family 2 protein [Leisingera sp. McT4-56]